MDKDKLISILEDLRIIRTKLDLEINDAQIFEQGVKIFLSEFIDSNKLKQDKVFPVQQPKLVSQNSPPTDSQINLMNNLGIKFQQGITKVQAAKIINDELNKRKQDEDYN